MNLPKMRSIKQAVELIKAEDSHSCISEYYIRTLCKQNKVKHIKSGIKVMVDYDDLLKCINQMNEDK